MLRENPELGIILHEQDAELVDQTTLCPLATLIRLRRFIAE
jgi:hypothetical protein